jgi:hypothetical protein
MASGVTGGFGGALTSTNNNFIWVFGPGSYSTTPDRFNIGSQGISGGVGATNVALSVVAPTGNVGIGTTNPGMRLEVKDTMVKTSVTQKSLAFFATSETSGPLGLAVQAKGGATSADRVINLQGTEFGLNPSDIWLQADGGNVVVGRAGATAPTTAANLEVNGQGYSKVVIDTTSTTSLTWNTNQGNTMRWTTASANLAVLMNNVKAGASYMLVVKGAGTGSVSISCSPTTAGHVASKYVPTNGNRIGGTAASKSVYTIVYDGEECLTTWITGF